MLEPFDIRHAVRSIVGKGAIDLHTPSIGPAEADSVSDCVDAGVIGYGYVDRVQALCAELCGAEQSVAVASGTAALHLAYLTAGVEPHTEVLMPALTFVGTANAAVYCGAIPHFIDTLDINVAPFKLRQYLGRMAERRTAGTFNRLTGRRISALTAVDLLGHPCDIAAIRAVTDYYGIPIIEDAAQALGSLDGNSPCGGRGHIGVISFNNNKIVTGNGGGMLLTNDPFIAAKAWNLATTARVAHPWQMNHDAVAFNYRMSNLSAALILPQLQRLDELIECKRRLAANYAEAFDGMDGVTVVREPDGCRSNYWLNAIMLDPLQARRRDEILAVLHGDGIACRTLFAPLFDLPMYRGNPRDNLEMTMDTWHRTICLPSSPKLGEAK